MGLAGSDNNNPQEVLQLWGADPVHPMETAYTKMAEKIIDEVNVIGVVNSRRAASPSAARGPPKHGTRERWTEETPILSPTGWESGPTAAAAVVTEAPAAAPEEPTGTNEGAEEATTARAAEANAVATGGHTQEEMQKFIMLKLRPIVT